MSNETESKELHTLNRDKFYARAEAFFTIVEKAAGKKKRLSDECVGFALERYAHFVWFNEPKFVGDFKKDTEKCCQDVGEALKAKDGDVIKLRDFERLCLAKEQGVKKGMATMAIGGICS